MKRTLDCGACALPTEHTHFETGGGVWVCSNCLAHWEKPRKAAVLYTCGCCGTRRLLFTQRGETVAKPVADCFRPAPKLVGQVEFLCNACVPEEVPRA